LTEPRPATETRQTERLAPPEAVVPIRPESHATAQLGHVARLQALGNGTSWAGLLWLCRVWGRVAAWRCSVARWCRGRDDARMLSVVVFDVNGTLTDPSAIGVLWERPELGDRVLGEAVSTAMVDALLGSVGI
jgi:hypothetical protein